MFELLFLIGFAWVLMIVGVNLIGIVAALLVGFALMAIAGMIGMLFNLLPWLILVAAIVWVCRANDPSAQKCRRYYYERRDKFRFPPK